MPRRSCRPKRRELDSLTDLHRSKASLSGRELPVNVLQLRNRQNLLFKRPQKKVRWRLAEKRDFPRSLSLIPLSQIPNLEMGKSDARQRSKTKLSKNSRRRFRTHPRKLAQMSKLKKHFRLRSSSPLPLTPCSTLSVLVEKSIKEPKCSSPKNLNQLRLTVKN